MRISDLIKMGIRNLTRRKARTVLTVLGVVIGAMCIIIMQSIGHGMDYNYKKQVEEHGSLTTITVHTWGDIYDQDGNWAGNQEQELNDTLVEQIRAMDYVRAVTPIIQMNATLFSGKYQGHTYITAMEKSAFEAFEFPTLASGAYPNDEDNTAIVFGFNQPYEFYDPTSRFWTPVQVDVLTDKIVLKFQNYPVNERKKEFSLPLNNIVKMEETKSEFDYNTYMDLDYFKEIYLKYCNTLSLDNRKKALEEINKYQQVQLNVDSIKHVEEVQDKIKELGFQSYSMMESLKPMIKASETLRIILSFLAAVSMFVSAISIANTMVMSIYERTKEIGIMKVLGCVIRDIRKLFLFEAGMIGMFGGLVGIILSYIASFLINKYGQPLFGALMAGGNTGNVEVASTFSIIPISLPFLAMGISIGVGLLSGYFPARRATRIRPIEAMKSEG